LSVRDEKLDAQIIRELFQSDKDNRYLIKRSEEGGAREAVFDRETLFTLYNMMNRGELDYLNGVVKAGKEARVYWGVKDGVDVAVKIFYTTTSNFKRRMPYMAGDPRFRKVKKYGKWLILEWVRKEFSNLHQAFEAHVSVPKPLLFQKNVLVMELIGKGGSPAPTLDNAEVNRRDYASILKNVRILYSRAKLVHADLSEFNIFKFDGKIKLFDMGSAVDRKHPMSSVFLERDIYNINRFFAKRGMEVKPLKEVMELIGVE